jgi:acyl-CoA synthetase (AMP-forming)/AMP-acid ligase II
MTVSYSRLTNPDDSPVAIAADCIAAVCAYRAQSQPDRLAFAFLNDALDIKADLTYQSLHQRAQSIAQELLARKLGDDATVLLLFAPGLAYIEAFLGCLFAGVIAVPAYPATSMVDFKRVLAIAADSEACLVLTSGEYVSPISCWLKANKLQQIPCISTDDLPAVVGQAIDVRNEIAFLQYTSGSTGDPKGVMVTQANLMHNLAQIYRLFRHSAQSVGVIWLPPYHDMGLIGGILQPLFAGFPVYLMSPFTFLKQPKRWLQAISKFRATTSGGPNFAYDLVIKHADRLKEPLDLSNWSVAFTGAEPIRQQTLDSFASTFCAYGFDKDAFYPCYGLAESTLIASGGEAGRSIISRTVDQSALCRNVFAPVPHHVDASHEGKLNRTTLVSSGRAVDNELVIVDPDTCELLQDGSIGEIWIRSRSVAKGYWRKKDLTRIAFGAMTHCRKGPYLRTGDLGVVADNELFVTGRVKELIIVNGQNHYPSDIELSVQDHHGDFVKKGAGTAFSHVVDNSEQLVIAQELRKNALNTCDFASLEISIKRVVFDIHRLHAHRVVLLPPGSIPKTSSGKLKRTEVQRLYAEGQLHDLRANADLLVST